MPMTGTGLKNAIKAATNPPGGFDDSQLALVCQAIVDYIKNNAVVSGSVNITVTSVTGVTTGPGVSGPGTGSGTMSSGTIA